MSEIEKKIVVAFEAQVCSEWLKQLNPYDYGQVSDIFAIGYLAGVEMMKDKTKDLFILEIHPDVTKQWEEYQE